MDIRSARRVVACALAVVATTPFTLRAQTRFDLLSRDTLARTPDVTVVTIRDRRTSNCYALFIGGQQPAVGALTEPVAPATSWIVGVTQPPPPPAHGSAGSITPWPVGNPGLWGSPGSLSNWGAPGVNTGQSGSPGTIPWTAAYPGMQTGGWELLAESVRRALIDPATVQTMSAPLLSALAALDDRLRRLESMPQSAEASRSVAVWPVSCTTNRP